MAISIINGAKGARGKDSKNGGAPTAGANGSDIFYTYNNYFGFDSLSIRVNGGRGGNGGNGIASGALGGNGGNASFTFSANIFNIAATDSLNLLASANGGDGGLGGTGVPAGLQGDGGNAVMTMSGNIIQPGRDMSAIALRATAMGGFGTRLGDASATISGNIVQPLKANRVTLAAFAGARGLTDDISHDGDPNFGIKTASVHGNAVTGNIRNVTLSADALSSNGTASIDGNFVQTNAGNIGIVTLKATGQHIAITNNTFNLGKQKLDIALTAQGPTYDVHFQNNAFTGTGANTLVLNNAFNPGPAALSTVDINLGAGSFLFNGQANALTNFANITLLADIAATLTGSDAANILTGAEGDDLITGGKANDILGGGNGEDAAVYLGAYHEYSLALSHVGDFAGTVTDLVAGRDGTDTLANIEFLRFSDGIYDVAQDSFSSFNEAPVAVDDAYATDEDTALVIAAPGLLGNDTDANSDALQMALIVTGPAHGSLTANADGSFTYTPDANYNGADSFSYRANDGTVDSNIATVNLTVNPVNDAPVAADDVYATNEDTALVITAPGLLANDTDVEGYPLFVESIVTAPLHGSLTVNIGGLGDLPPGGSQPPGTGSFTYTPDTNYHGPDSFTYIAGDSQGGSNIATVHLTVNSVNDAPVAVDDAYATNEDTALVITAPGLLFNDTDADGDALHVSAIITGPLPIIAGPTHGSLTANADGSFTYTPDANFNGADSFSYRASDGAAESNIATVNLVINPVNDAPVAVDDAYVAYQDTPLVITGPGLLANDTDVDGDTLNIAPAVIVTGQPGQGLVVMNADGSFTYTPDFGYYGPDQFTYRANDGTADSNIATVNLTVNQGNEPPFAIDDAYTTNEDTPLIITEQSLVANDIDPNSDALRVYDIVTAPAYGTLVGNPDGYFTYTPNFNYRGADSFTYRANDSALVSINVATVNLYINPVNDAPVAVDDAYVTNEDTALVITAPGLLANDGDSDGDALQVGGIVTGPAHGSLASNTDGSFTYTPDANYNGADSFSYQISDGKAPLGGDSYIATVNLTVNPVNDAPVLDASKSPALAAVLEDVGFPAPGAAVGTLVSSLVDFALPAGQVDNVTDADSGAQLGIALTGAATSNGNWFFSVNNGNTWNAVGAVSDASALLLAADTATRLYFQPNADFNGTVTNAITFRAWDMTSGFNGGTGNALVNGGNTAFSAASDVANISVSPVNNAPVATGEVYETNEDTALVITAPGLLANDTDADGDALHVSAIIAAPPIAAGPAHGSLTANADGSFTYTPDANYNGADSFSYRIGDGTAESNIATVNLVINPVNDAPVAADDAYVTNEETALVITAPGMLANDTDADGAPLHIGAIVTGPAHGLLNANADGSFTYTPTASYSGADSFTYKANDGETDSNIATVNLTVNNVNHAPVAYDGAAVTIEDTPMTFSGSDSLFAITEVDAGDVLHVGIVTYPTNGLLQPHADGTYTYTPDANWSGIDSFTYKATDGTADSNIATVFVTVNPVNDAPVAGNDVMPIAEDGVRHFSRADLQANDFDVDVTDVTASLTFIDLPTHGTLTTTGPDSYAYTPNANFNGLDSFTYKTNDGTADSNIATVYVTVNPVNDAPVAVDDAYVAYENFELFINVSDLLVNDTDVEGDALQMASIVTGPALGSLVVNGDILVYRPLDNYYGPDQFTYRANDGTADSNIATVYLNVNQNSPPAAQDDYFNLNEDTPARIYPYALLDNDTNFKPGSIFSVSAIFTAPAHGTLMEHQDGYFLYTPDENYNGADSFTYRAGDGSQESAPATVHLQIMSHNDEPVAADDYYQTDQGVALYVPAVNVQGLLANDTDVDSPSLYVSAVVTGPSHGTLTESPAGGPGGFVYTPDAGYYGADSFTYTANDGFADSAVATVRLSVNLINQSPSHVSDINNDGYGDLVFSTSNLGYPVQIEIQTQGTASTIDLGDGGRVVGTGGFTGFADRRDGLLLQDSVTGNLKIISNIDGAPFSRAFSIQPGSADWKAITAGDFNGDDFADVLLQNQVTGATEIMFLRSQPGAVFAVTPVAGPAGFTAISAGDFNGDGKSDILFQDAVTKDIQVDLMNGATVSSFATLSPGAGFDAIGTGDFNDDGFSDVLFQSGTDAVIWTMDGVAQTGTINVAAPVAAGTWTVMGAQDINNDGFSDILWQDAGTGNVSATTMTPWTIVGNVMLGAGPDSSYRLVASTGGG